VNATLTALAEPNRLQIVNLLRGGPRPVGGIVEQLHLRQPQVSKHLRVLSDAGLVEARPVAQQRIYSLRPEPFRELGDWLDSYRRLWNERMDRFDEVLQDLKQRDQVKETGDEHGEQ
jgi:DNA-binding transcriptional ArsR family regulator